MEILILWLLMTLVSSFVWYSLCKVGRLWEDGNEEEPYNAKHAEEPAMDELLKILRRIK